MMVKRFLRWTTILTIVTVCAWPALAADEALPDSEVLVRALADELGRAMDLQMEDLEKPYFIQYGVEDDITHSLSAGYGALTASSRDRSRLFYAQVRVGSYQLDNTNYAADTRFYFPGVIRGGGQANLPVDDDYFAIRQAIWRATDGEYKEAVETLTKKRAYMRDKRIEDRPDDFSQVQPVEHSEPTAVLRFDQARWEENLRRISAHFKQYDQVQDSGVQLSVGAGNAYVVTSEGTRVRTADTGAVLRINAAVQAEDGMRISSGRNYVGDAADDLPPVDEILADIDTLVDDLTAAMKASAIEHYTGPVLFDARSAAQMFRVMLAGGVVGKVDPVGTERRRFAGAENLEKKIGQRILPRSFQVYDDPTVKEFDDTVLFGHYRYDDEGVPAQRLDIVVDGELKDMCLSRVPTKKLSGSNGHARRSPGSSAPAASVGSLFIEDDKGLSDEELKAALLEAAEDEGLEYGLRIESISSVGLGTSQADMLSSIMRVQRRGGGLGDPIVAYKVYVEDGREEPFRGCEFGPIEVTELKRILAGGNTPEVYNYVGFGLGGTTPPSTIVAPPVLFEELELSKIEQEHDKLPILKVPLAR